VNLNQKLASILSLTALLVLAAASVARADLSPGKVDTNETKFDNENTTMQDTGHETNGPESCGSVSDNGQLSTSVQWLMTNHQTSSDQCNGGNEGDLDKDKDKDKDGGEGESDKDDPPPPSVVPEPTTLLLLGTGLCLLGGALRRRIVTA
jgi:hypothetical protein